MTLNSWDWWLLVCVLIAVFATLNNWIDTWGNKK